MSGDRVLPTLVCASANPDKVYEIEQLLDGVVRLLPRPPEIPDVVEDADTLVGNARLKAMAILQATGLPAVADDTGMFVDALPGESAQHDRLCELNVIEQVANVCQTTIVQDAWARGQNVTVHGWIYGLKDGLLRNLNTSVANPADLPTAQAAALAAL